jgi:twitching motility protein PilT
MGYNLVEILGKMGDMGASDLHLKSGVPPRFRAYGRLNAIGEHPLSAQDLKLIAEKLVPQRLQSELSSEGSVDFAFQLNPHTRFRCNAYHQRGTLSIAMRILQNDFKRFEEMHLPPVMHELVKIRRGLILVTGPTGSGKSTTMASLINEINEHRDDHIITIEDPIEFVHNDKKSMLQQREIGTDCANFSQALKHALRQDPDTILVGEMRDAETIMTAMRAAMTGHLVISTLHTINATQTVRRILRYFPPEEQDSMRGELAIALKAVVSQRLIPMADGKGRVPQVEILIVNDMVKKLMKNDKIEDIDQVLKNGMDGMQHFDISLVDLTKAGLISHDLAEEYAEDIAAYRRMRKGGSSGGDRSGLIGGF